jgi:hypothetical protein
MDTDPAREVIEAVGAALKVAFPVTGEHQPEGGGSDLVRFMAGDTLPLAAWNAHTAGGCGDPLLWVRLMRRYRSKDFPAPSIEASSCGRPVALAIEVGVARCAVMDPEPHWDDYQREAIVSLDDSWRIEMALCHAAGCLKRDKNLNASTDTIVPFGPEGGVIAWSGVLYVHLI